jgi:hypothetical protein
MVSVIHAQIEKMPRERKYSGNNVARNRPTFVASFALHKHRTSPRFVYLVSSSHCVVKPENSSTRPKVELTTLHTLCFFLLSISHSYRAYIQQSRDVSSLFLIFR